MKKLILILPLFSFLCMSQITVSSIPEFTNRIEAMQWVHDEITFESRNDLLFVQSPSKTLRLKTGVCQDKAVLLMYILKTQFNDAPEFISISTDQSSNFHAIVRVENILYDPTANESPIKSYNITLAYYALNYADTMAWASLND